MDSKKVGFFENSLGEKSFTRLLNFFLFVFILGMWGAESISKSTIVPLDPTVLALLLAAMANSGVQKWIESNGNSEQVKFIKGVMAKVKKKE